MHSGLQSSSFSIVDILSGPFLLNVPVYQRPFAWTSEEAGQLLDDIIDAAAIESDGQADADYFLGSVLLMDSSGNPPVKLSKSMPFREFDIVDGQQRLVTFLTLIAVLRDLEIQAKGPIAKRAGEMVMAKLRSGFFRSERYRIHLAQRGQNFFEKYILEPGATRREPADTLEEGPEASLLQVRDHFRSILSDYTPEDRRKIFDYASERCEVVVILSDDIDRAYRMFIVLNERGKSLQRNDILKADVVSRLASPDLSWAVKAWDDTSEELGDDFETFFSHMRTIYGHSRNQVVSAVRAVVQEEGGAANFIKNALMPLSETFAAIRKNDHSVAGLTPRMRWYLHYLNRHSEGDWAPAAMLALRNRLDDPAGTEQLLSEIDRLAHLLRLLCLGAGRRSKRFADVVTAMRNGEMLDAGHPVFAISRDEVRNIAFHLKDLHKRNQKMCKLLLMRLSDEIAGSISNLDPNGYTIEHVLPQRPPNASEWRKWFPSAEIRVQCTESLGNLVLISQAQNDKARNALFAEKKRIFAQGHVLPITRDVLACAEWHKFEIDAREEHLVGLIRRIWRIDLPASKSGPAKDALPPSPPGLPLRDDGSPAEHAVPGE